MSRFSGGEGTQPNRKETMSQFERATDPRPSVADDELRQDLLAAYAASRELPSSQERAIVMSFLERLDQTLDARIEARIEEMIKRKKLKQWNPAGVVAASLGLSIPLLAIAGEQGGPIGVIAVLGSVLVVNLVALTKS